ncbi:MAG: pyrroline-5-carboxylate reductase [Pseudomonadota bacterium]
MSEFSDLISAERPLVLLGCGNMGKALLAGWLGQGLPREHIFIVDPFVAERGLPDLDIGEEQCASRTLADMIASVLVLAVKPQIFDDAAASVAGACDGETIGLSIMAGTSIETISAALPELGGVVRTMPNTPAAVGKGVTGLFAQPSVSEDARALCETLLGAVGATVWVPQESDLNAVTALSGSGPAYVFHMIECLTLAGEQQGLSQEVAQTLAIETVRGAGVLAATAVDTPTQLRVKVTSPGGTTQAGLDVLMKEGSGLEPLISQTVAAAKARAEELG